MKNKIVNFWCNIPSVRKYIALFFAQVWFWPQVFYGEMPANIGIPLALTAASCIVYNFVLVIINSDQ